MWKYLSIKIVNLINIITYSHIFVVIIQILMHLFIVINIYY